MKLTVGIRLFLAASILFFVAPYNQFAAMLMAAIVLKFPSWKYYPGRLCDGAQKSDELIAIEKVTDQVEKFKKDLGDRASKKDVDEAKKALDELKANIGKYSEKEIDAALDTINKANEKLHKQMEEMAEDVAKAKEKGASGLPKIQMFDPADVAKFVKDTFNGSEKTNVKATIKLNTQIVLKAAETFGYPQFFEGAGAASDITPFTGRFIDPTLYQRKRKRNFILDNMSIETIGVPTLIYLEKVEVAGANESQEDTGSAAWIVSGGEKPKRSFRVTSSKVDAKKVAIFGTVEDKLLRDVPSLENWIREDFTDEIREAYNDALLNNNPAIDEDAPLGLKENAIQYADTTPFNNTIPYANEIDAIIAACAYMAHLKEQPEMVAVSSSIYYKLFVLKDNDARYQNNNLIYTNSLGQIYIAGVRIVMADDEDIPDTHLMVIGASGFRIKNYGSMVFERGLNGEDFRYDRTSFRAYQEVLSYIPSQRYNSVLYDTFANIIAAILKP